MKSVACLLLCLFVLLPARAQDRLALPFEQVDSLYLVALEEAHASALHSDTSLAVFPDRPDEVVAAWGGLLQAFSAHLQANGFAWTEPIRGYYRFYFHPDGRIHRVVYNQRGMDAARATRYNELLDRFSRTYQFPLTADRPFAQCSPATFQPVAP